MMPLWKTNTGQKRSFFFGSKILSKINPRGCNMIPKPLRLYTNIQVDTAPVSSKKFLEIQATIECRFTLKRARDMKITYSQTQSNKYVKQLLLSCILEREIFYFIYKH